MGYSISNFYGITREWTPARECELDPRAMRIKVAEFNDNFGIDNKHRDYILSSVQGYRITRDLKEIRDAILHDQRIAFTREQQLKNRRDRLERLIREKKHGGRLV